MWLIASKLPDVRFAIFVEQQQKQKVLNSNHSLTVPSWQFANKIFSFFLGEVCSAELNILKHQPHSKKSEKNSPIRGYKKLVAVELYNIYKKKRAFMHGEQGSCDFIISDVKSTEYASIQSNTHEGQPLKNMLNKFA